MSSYTSCSTNLRARPLAKRWLAPTVAVVLLLAGTGGIASALNTPGATPPYISTPPLGDVKSILPVTYAEVVAPSLPVYSNPLDPMIDLPPTKLFGAGFVWVSLFDPEPILHDNQVWYQIQPNEYVPAEYVRIRHPSEYQGVHLSAQPDMPLAWVVYGARASNSPGIPPAQNAVSLPRYALVTIYEERQIGQWMWYRIGENQWLEQRQLGIVRVSPRPEGIGPNDKWVDVNLFEQTLAAYEGDRMVMATLISSGLARWPTPTGLYRVWAKVAASKMSGREGYADYYFLEDVPWILYFNQSVALHGTYWHDRFGTRRSHGCVNLSPQDALWLFNWATPVAGPGNWTLSNAENQGAWVWVHD